MIKRLFLKFGPFGSSDRLIVQPEAMNVFVGPNNSGKSLVLRELKRFADQGPGVVYSIVESIEIEFPSDDEVQSMLHRRKEGVDQDRRPGYDTLARPNPSMGGVDTVAVQVEDLIRNIGAYRNQNFGDNVDSINSFWRGIYTNFLTLFSVSLDGKTRLSLTEDRNAGDILAVPANHLAELFRNDELRIKVRDIIQSAFDLYFVIDPARLGFLRIRMARRAPVDDQEEQALDSRARRFHADATHIAELSDGVKAFTGLISTLVSSDFRVMLVDEAEAFLHPPLASYLGQVMATIADERSANVFASTHSSRFLMGCIESGKPVNIIRLTYNSPYATARLLSSDQINELMCDPLLRNAGVLDALFYSGSIVCEADKDRVFYAEINNRLKIADWEYLSDVLFLNAQNKQTVKRLVGPLRSMGIPSAAIVDIDIIKGDDLRELLKECFVPAQIVKSIGQLRGEVCRLFDGEGLDMKSGGISLLSGENREACIALLDQLATYGVFVVPNGELESWLVELGEGASKENWLPTVFERMKTDPGDDEFVSPTDGDVWEFLSKVLIWMSNEDRLGMPRAG